MAADSNELPEGTDHIINGAMRTDQGGSGGTDNFVAPARTSDDTGGTAMTDDRGTMRGQVRQGIADLKQQAAGRVREAAADGKTRASDALDEFARVVEEAAESIEERLGPQFSPVARRAAQAVGSFATTLRERDPEELYEDVNNFVRKSPGVALGIAAALGFVAVRLIKAGTPSGDDGGSANRSRARSQSTADV